MEGDAGGYVQGSSNVARGSLSILQQRVRPSQRALGRRRSEVQESESPLPQPFVSVTLELKADDLANVEEYVSVFSKAK